MVSWRPSPLHTARAGDMHRLDAACLASMGTAAVRILSLAANALQTYSMGEPLSCRGREDL